jgi:hypothetical protein
MVVEWIASLAMTGGTTLVGAMAGDGWAAIRDRCSALFGHRDADQAEQLRRQLDADAAELAAADEAERTELADELADSWRVRLRDLLKAHPEARAELTALIEAAPAVGHQQRNEARDGGVVFAVQDGRQHITYYGGSA